MNMYHGMSRKRLEEILNRIGTVRAALIGDVCLDMYWFADMRLSQLSRETPHYPLPIVEEKKSPGAGGNAAANMAALCPKRLSVISAVGEDWRGRELCRLLAALKIDISGVAISFGLTTNAYIKPMRRGISDVVYEDPRLDFAFYEPVSEEIEEAVLHALDTVAGQIDVLCVSDQMPFGVITERVREHIIRLGSQGLKIVADSRERIGLYRNIILKPNELEGMRAAGMDPGMPSDFEQYVKAAHRLSIQNDCEVFMTLGANGSLAVGQGQTWLIPPHEIEGPIDICGAGDSSLSGFALSLAAGAEPQEAAFVAGLCSEVTIRQIGTTGTAARSQILARYEEVCGK